MGTNQIARGRLFPTTTMKRICSLCLQEVIYHKVKKYPHGLQLCCYCSDTLAELSSSVDSIFKHR